MAKNVGGFDRILRVVAGVALLAWAFVPNLMDGTGATPINMWGLVGIVPLFTALIGWCPAYLPFGLSSCKIKKS